MPKNLLILKFLYGRDRPRGLLAFKELDPIPQFKATAKLGKFLESRFSQSF